jgi:cation:H+ antiporter
VFNIFILAIDDHHFMKGPLLSFAGNAHVISAVSAISMTTIAVISLTYRVEKKTLSLVWDSIGIVMIYIGKVMVVHMLC